MPLEPLVVVEPAQLPGVDGLGRDDGPLPSVTDEASEADALAALKKNLAAVFVLQPANHGAPASEVHDTVALGRRVDDVLAGGEDAGLEKREERFRKLGRGKQRSLPDAFGQPTAACLERGVQVPLAPLRRVPVENGLGRFRGRTLVLHGFERQRKHVDVGERDDADGQAFAKQGLAFAEHGSWPEDRLDFEFLVQQRDQTALDEEDVRQPLAALRDRLPLRECERNRCLGQDAERIDSDAPEQPRFVDLERMKRKRLQHGVFAEFWQFPHEQLLALIGAHVAGEDLVDCFSRNAENENGIVTTHRDRD